MPSPEDPELAYFVREAWESHSTGASLTEGILHDEEVSVTSEMDDGVVFGDGIETDVLVLPWAREVRISRAPRALRLVA